MRPEHRVFTLGHTVRDLIDIQVGSVGSQDSSGFSDGVQPRENLLLSGHFFIYSFNDDVCLLQILDSGRGRNSCQSLIHICLCNAPFTDCGGVVLFDRGHASIQRLGVLLNDRNRNSGVGEVHTNPAPHGPCPDNTSVGKGPTRHLSINPRHLRSSPFSKENVAHRLGFFGSHAFLKDLPLPCKPFSKGQRDGGFNTLDTSIRCPHTTSTSFDLGPFGLKDAGIFRRYRDIAGQRMGCSR